MYDAQRQPAWTAKDHAREASRLLIMCHDEDRKIIDRQQDPMSQLRDAATGANAVFNMQQKWRAQLAVAHAEVAQAMMACRVS